MKWLTGWSFYQAFDREIRGCASTIGGLLLFVVSFLFTQAPVVQKLDSAIHRINLYPVDNAIGFPNTYPLDSDLSGG